MDKVNDLNMDKVNEISEKLRYIAARNAWSMSELARRIPMSIGHLCRLTRHQKIPGPLMLLRIELFIKREEESIRRRDMPPEALRY